MNETAIVYIVHSDLDENNIFAMFEDEVEAIMYARRHKEDLTYVDKTEMSLDESGDYDEVLSAETIWVYDEEDDDEDELTDEEIEALIQADEDEKWAEADLGDTTWFEDLDTDKLVETLEENEDIVECKECFELFPKEECTKIAIGYICPECGKIHSHEEPEFEIDSIPDVVIADEDTFKIDFPELERTEYGNDMIPDEPTPEVENDPISEPEPMAEPCVGPECEAPVEAPVTKDETITKLVVDEHEAIDGYEKAKIEIEANSELDEKEKEEILDTIEHIKEEEIEHIEELEELVDEAEETKADEPAEEPEEKEILHEDDRNIFKKLVSNPDWYWEKGGHHLLSGNVDKHRVPRQGYIIKKAAIKEGKLEISADFYKEVNKYGEAEKIAKAESADDNSFVYIVTPKGEPKSIYLVVYSKGQVLKGTESWLQKALDKKAADKNVVTKQLDWKLNITQIAVGEEKELKVLNNEDKVIKSDLYTLEVVEEVTESNVELDTTKRILKGVSKGDAEIKITKIDTKQTVAAKVTVVETKEEPKDEVKPDQETQTTYKYKADPITVTVEGKAKPIIVKSNDDLNTKANIKKCKVAANKEGIVKLIEPSKNKGWFVEGLKPGKVTLTITLGDTTICTCEVTVKQKPLSPEENEAIEQAKKLLTDKGYRVEDPKLESLTEHVNEEHPAIESDQELVGTNNAVIDCKVNKVITHSEDEKPVDCKGEKKPLKKPLTESLSKDQLQVMEEYLKSTKFASLETEWTDEGDFYIDECSAYLDYSAKTKTFTLGLSIYHASEDNNAEYPEDHTDEAEYSYDSLAEMYEDEECRKILDMLYEENEHDFTESLTEETHAKYAKPEGNRVQAFNNALKYAKKENKPFIYGYTNHTGKFFAAETPMKVTGSPAEAEKEFRQQYKNCKVVYVVYPDKEFIREGLFTKQEQEEYNMDEDGNSLDSYDTYVRCGFCDEIYTKSECKYERNLGWLCPRCEAAIYSRGEKLTFVDPDEFLEN